MEKENKCLSECPVFGFYRVSRILMRSYSHYLEPLGLTYPQYLVMLYIRENGPASVDKIGATLLLDSGTLTPLLKRLQAKGLLSRTRDSKDERRCIITLTSEGCSAESRIAEIQKKVAQHFNLDPEFVKSLNSALKQILDVSGNK